MDSDLIFVFFSSRKLSRPIREHSASPPPWFYGTSPTFPTWEGCKEDITHLFNPFTLKWRIPIFLFEKKHFSIFLFEKNIFRFFFLKKTFSGFFSQKKTFSNFFPQKKHFPIFSQKKHFSIFSKKNLGSSSIPIIFYQKFHHFNKILLDFVQKTLQVWACFPRSQ